MALLLKLQRAVEFHVRTGFLLDWTAGLELFLFQRRDTLVERD